MHEAFQAATVVSLHTCNIAKEQVWSRSGMYNHEHVLILYRRQSRRSPICSDRSFLPSFSLSPIHQDVELGSSLPSFSLSLIHQDVELGSSESSVPRRFGLPCLAKHPNVKPPTISIRNREDRRH